MARSLLFGTSVSPGIAIGVLRFAHNVQTVEMRRISPREVEGEQEQLRAAVTNVRAALQEAMAKVPEDLSEYREVIAAQIELARDPKLVGSALSRIEKELVCAAWALDSTVEQLCSIFRNMDDPYLRDRAQDIRAVGLRLRECLAGSCALPAAAGAGILAAQDLSPADVMDMDFKDVRAVITAEGGPTSHTAILSRGLHIPALVGVTGLLETGKPGEKVIVDGLNGCLLLDPDADDLATYEERQREYQEWEARTRSESHWPAEMRDGVRVSVHANLERLEEMDELQASGAEGVGLYRTEFSFLREHLPSEEELYAEYSAVARKAAPAHVVFRTLDAGADKMLRAQEALKEPNPALGLRGIRFCLRHQKIFRSQLRALMRAGVEGNISLLLPMISGLAEVQSVRRIMQELQQELQAAAPEPAPRVIPLYCSPAAAGYAAPVFGEDYEPLPVTGEVPTGAELAVRIQGDSMEPYIHDGSVVYVNHDPLRAGDVGIFCVDGDMLCKQYYRDPLGVVYLFSLNRRRADADVILPPSSGRSLTCFGRVMLHGLPIPE